MKYIFTFFSLLSAIILILKVGGIDITRNSIQKRHFLNLDLQIEESKSELIYGLSIDEKRGKIILCLNNIPAAA